MRAALIGIFAFHLSAWAQPETVFQELRDGFPPVWTAEEFSRSQTQLTGLLEGLQPDFRTSAWDTPNCARFKSAVSRLIGQLAKQLAGSDLKGFSSAESVHFRVQAIAFTEAFSLFSQGREGGFGILLAGAGDRCRYASYESIQRRFSYAATFLMHFIRDGLGGPGLIRLENTQLKLLEEADRNELSRAKHGWLLAGAAAVTSIVIWRFAPGLAAAGSRTLFGRVPVVMSRPLFIFGVRTSALTAEGLAVAGTLQKLNPAPELPNPASVPSWDDKMQGLEAIVNAGRSATELDFFYLAVIKAGMAGLYLPYLTRHQDELEKQNGYRDMVESLAESREIAGKLPRHAAAELSSRLRGSGFDVTCDQGHFGLTDAACLRGMMAFARGTYMLPANTMGARNARVVIHADSTHGQDGALPSLAFNYLGSAEDAAKAVQQLAQ